MTRLQRSLHELKSKAASLRKDKRGAVVVLFAIAAVPALLLTGMAIEYGNALRIHSKLQTAADSGVIAGATVAAVDCNMIANADGTNCGKAYIKSTVEKAINGSLANTFKTAPTISTTVDNDGTVTTRVSVTQPWIFAKLTGSTGTSNAVTSQAIRGSGKLEVALVLDTTGSMAGAKIAGLQSAATALTDTLYAVPDAANRIKIGVVPFAQYVNVGTIYKGAKWLTSTADVKGPTSCWDEYPNATYSNPYTVNQTCYSDGSPYDCSYTAYATVNYGAPVQVCGSWTSTWQGCVGSRNYPTDLKDEVLNADPVPALLDTWCSQALTRLTNDSAAIKAAIAGLTPSGETYIAPGLLWGWRVLSSKAPFSDGGTAGNSLSKIMILMTDGANTLSPSYPAHNDNNVATANTLTAETCAKIKADGISIYTIAFSVTDVTVKNILQSCASGPLYFYDASTIADMKAAFAVIGAKLTAIRISK
jgi:Flp pilus assembly protein TadG